MTEAVTELVLDLAGPDCRVLVGKVDGERTVVVESKGSTAAVALTDDEAWQMARALTAGLVTR
jgi:hypothetical protein